MSNTNEHIEQLILRQLTNEASGPELAELQQWLDASPGNREEYAALRQIWESSLTVLQPPAFDTAAAWQKLKGRRSGSMAAEPLPGVRPLPEVGVRMRWRALLAAAVVLGLIAGGWLIYRRTSAPKMEELVALNGTERASLPDSSIVWLRKGSTIRYPMSFAHDRRVELEGEAYFEVTEDAANTFRVQTSKGLIEVLGTRFVARQTNEAEKLLVTAGRVRFSDRGASGRQLVLVAGESATLTASGMEKDSLVQQNMLAWKTNVLEFRNSPLPVVIADLVDLYGIGVAISPELRDSAENIRINARFSYTEKPAQVLEEIRLMTGLSVRRQKDTVIFFHP